MMHGQTKHQMNGLLLNSNRLLHFSEFSASCRITSHSFIRSTVYGIFATRRRMER